MTSQNALGAILSTKDDTEVRHELRGIYQDLRKKPSTAKKPARCAVIKKRVQTRAMHGQYHSLFI